jgi:hypothetical protein
MCRRAEGFFLCATNCAAIRNLGLNCVWGIRVRSDGFSSNEPNGIQGRSRDPERLNDEAHSFFYGD